VPSISIRNDELFGVRQACCRFHDVQQIEELNENRNFQTPAMTSKVTNPLALIAELTHRCPLHCVYCSNPLELQARGNELSTEIWSRVFREASSYGVLQADFTGGEPLARPDLVELVRAARVAGLYVSLITSGMPLDEARLSALVEAGLDHIQLSFQAAREELANEICGTKAYAQKLRVLDWLKQHRVALTLNFVIHRRNIDQIEEMLALAESSSATRVEFANVQYYGWAFANREHLLPTREQLARSVEFLKRAEERLRGKIRVEFVVPDYYAKYPKACMGGWGRKLMLITPSGDALPCHAAQVIPGLKFQNVKERSLREIWEHSEAFQKFRGEDWMQEPCRSCDRREHDFGGCRCQAFLLAGDATATDPVCSFAPQRSKVDVILAEVNRLPATENSEKPGWLYRPNPA
jgi:PqqA peptide cyclase